MGEAFSQLRVRKNTNKYIGISLGTKLMVHADGRKCSPELSIKTTKRLGGTS